MNYRKIYNQLIEKRQINKLSKSANNIGGVESHHILPQCLGGTNDKTNIVNLTPREHYICHLLLWKIYPNHLGINFALMSMANNTNKTNQRTFKYCSRLFEKAKLAFAKRMQQYYTENPGSIKGKTPVYNILAKRVEYFEKYKEYPEYIIPVKLIWICNNTTNAEMQIPDFENIPNGWHKGRRKNIRTSHTGLIMISNPKTLEVKYVEKDSELPVGWKFGKSRAMNLARRKKYFKIQREKYVEKAKQIFDYFVSNELSFTKLISKFPELSEYKSCTYILQLFWRYLPSDLNAKQTINGLKKQLAKNGITPFEGRWNNVEHNNHKNNGKLHKIKQAIIGSFSLKDD